MITRSFYFIRHGQTDWNAAERVQGSTDIPLNSRGGEQAIHAARAVARQPIDLLVTSDLCRAAETAALINLGLGLKVIVDPLIREKHFGILEGKTLLEIDALEEVINRDITRRMQSNGKRQPEGAEFHDDFEARVVKAFDENLKKYPKANILFISHGAVFKAIHTALFGEKLGCENAVLYHFEKTADGWKLHDLSEEK